MSSMIKSFPPCAALLDLMRKNPVLVVELIGYSPVSVKNSHSSGALGSFSPLPWNWGKAGPMENQGS